MFSLDDLKWRQVEGLDPERSPGARSGFSFIPCPEGAILHGGYRKDYVKGLRPKGVPLDDTWLLRCGLQIRYASLAEQSQDGHGSDKDQMGAA